MRAIRGLGALALLLVGGCRAAAPPAPPAPVARVAPPAPVAPATSALQTQAYLEAVRLCEQDRKVIADEVRVRETMPEVPHDRDAELTARMEAYGRIREAIDRFRNTPVPGPCIELSTRYGRYLDIIYATVKAQEEDLFQIVKASDPTKAARAVRREAERAAATNPALSQAAVAANEEAARLRQTYGLTSDVVIGRQE